MALTCSIAWLPAYFWATRVHQTHTPVHKLLGLRLEGLPRTVADSLFLVSTLFAGPLVYFLHCIQLPKARAPPRPPTPRRPLPPQGTAAIAPDANDCDIGEGGDMGGAATTSSMCSLRRRLAAGQGDTVTSGMVSSDRAASESVSGYHPCATAAAGGADVASQAVAAATAWLSDTAGNLIMWRNLVAAPLAEEFVFRACMVPLLLMEGVSSWVVVFATPLFFAVAHMHHIVELVRHQGFSVRHATLMVSFQVLYTTVFGWLATYLFLRTGHLAAPVVAHAVCNWAGFPPFGDMAAHPRGPLLLLTTAAGVAAFFAALPRMTEPTRYGQDVYAAFRSA